MRTDQGLGLGSPKVGTGPGSGVGTGPGSGVGTGPGPGSGVGTGPGPGSGGRNRPRLRLGHGNWSGIRRRRWLRRIGEHNEHGDRVYSCYRHLAAPWSEPEPDDPVSSHTQVTVPVPIRNGGQTIRLKLGTVSEPQQGPNQSLDNRGLATVGSGKT